MKRKMQLTVFALFLIVVSCAVITVNIYFPEKDVKEAYKVLEEELMKTNGQGDKQMPESSIRFELITTAYAQDADLADKIAETIKKMPDVVTAYEDMGKRLPEIDRLRDSGKVGEGNKGFLVRREGQLSEDEKNLVDDENENRKTIMTGMAKAIIRINRLPQNQENMKQVTPQAVEQFASVRRDAAKKGWWIQDENGNWLKK
jgi:uncharacterized protein YdbL (DUF1318 family)